MNIPGERSSALWRRRASLVGPLAALAVVILLASCKTSTEAAAAAKDLASTASSLADYYNDLASQVTQTIELAQLDAKLDKNKTFDEDDHAQLDSIKKEFSGRCALAQSLAKLASTYASLAGSTAPSDVATATSKWATEVQNDLKSLKVLPAAPKSGPAAPATSIVSALPSASQASKLLTEFIQTHELKTGARAIQQCVDGLNDLYMSESSIYITFSTARIQTAERLAKKLIDDDQVELSSVLSPALQPFALTPKPGATMDWYGDLMKSQITEQANAQVTAYKQKTEALGKALQNDDAELATVITGKQASSTKAP